MTRTFAPSAISTRAGRTLADDEAALVAGDVRLREVRDIGVGNDGLVVEPVGVVAEPRAEDQADLRNDRAAVAHRRGRGVHAIVEPLDDAFGAHRITSRMRELRTGGAGLSAGSITK